MAKCGHANYLEQNCPHCNQDVKAISMVERLRALGYEIKKAEDVVQTTLKGQFIDATIGDDFETIKINRKVDDGKL